MLLSMTGFGESRSQSGDWHLAVELRSINNRHFKLNLRCPDGFFHYEADLERLLRETISRGTVSLTIRLDSAGGAGAPRLNRDVMLSYWNQLRDLSVDLGAPHTPAVAELLQLPGVLDDGRLTAEQVEALWPFVQEGVRAAVVRLDEFRQREGAAMAADLRTQCEAIEKTLGEVVTIAPQVITDYRDKLQQRVQKLLEGTGITLEQDNLIREVAFFADRCDINEEITRLRSHIEQFLGLLAAKTSQGRKLEFLCQEMFRESNTIGSKANHVGVGHAAVDMKTCIERIREVIANIE
ncbi:YicC/YloC family endoribonuclease [Planctellipticum variicoloris]|uniref:YicC/YloC family endoribonuclease n=1 Tax=Planctellipticum variicoloris TaxID=3064265 RepID=UPI003013640D|nr:YicC family protein [Planctomycetaceae bacterium SH412]